MRNHQILKPSFNRVDERGTFTEVLNSGHWEALTHGSMKTDAVMGNHYHKKTDVFFFLTRGRARISTVHVETGEEDQFTLAMDEGVILGSLESHAIRFLDDSEFIMLKSLRYDPDDSDTYPHPVDGSD